MKQRNEAIAVSKENAEKLRELFESKEKYRFRYRYLFPEESEELKAGIQILEAVPGTQDETNSRLRKCINYQLKDDIEIIQEALKKLIPENLRTGTEDSVDWIDSAFLQSLFEKTNPNSEDKRIRDLTRLLLRFQLVVNELDICFLKIGAIPFVKNDDFADAVIEELKEKIGDAYSAGKNLLDIFMRMHDNAAKESHCIRPGKRKPRKYTGELAEEVRKFFKEMLEKHGKKSIATRAVINQFKEQMKDEWGFDGLPEFPDPIKPPGLKEDKRKAVDAIRKRLCSM